jgi:hypothetical protein
MGAPYHSLGFVSLRRPVFIVRCKVQVLDYAQHLMRFRVGLERADFFNAAALDMPHVGHPHRADAWWKALGHFTVRVEFPITGLHPVIAQPVHSFAEFQAPP